MPGGPGCLDLCNGPDGCILPSVPGVDGSAGAHYNPPGMRKRPFSRSLIGLAAAYLVALQALILPLSLPALAHGGALCVTTADGTAPPPAGGDHGCPCDAGCGMQCHAPALDLLRPGVAASLPAPRAALAALLVLPPPGPSPAPTTRGLRMPRGPPAA